MDNIIKVWIVTIIITITALLLPTIIANADDERQPLERFKHWHITNKDLGTGELDKHEIYYGYDGTDDQLKTFSVIAHSNKYGTSERPATVHYAVVYNDTDKPLVHAFNTNQSSTQTIESGGYIKTVVGSVVFDPVRIYSSNATYYIDFEDEKINIDEFIQSIIGGVVPDGTKTLNPDLVWDDELLDYVNPKEKYDLEIVKGVSINIGDSLKDDYIIKWKPSEELQNQEYYRNVKLEVYQIFKGRVKRALWNAWNDFYFDPYLVESPYAYKESWKGNYIDSDISDLLIRDFMNFNDTEGYISEFYKSDFALRYRYVDENNVVHYSSNFVYLQCKDDDTYTISVPDTNKTDDITPDVPTIKVDDYTDDVILEDTDDIEVTNIFTTIKSLFNTLKEFPDYFGKIFNMFPTWIITLISFGIGALITIGILKAIL